MGVCFWSSQGSFGFLTSRRAPYDRFLHLAVVLHVLMFPFSPLFLSPQPALFDPTMKKKKKKKPKPTATDDAVDVTDGATPLVNGSAGNDLPVDDALPVGGAAAPASAFEIDESEFAPMDFGKKKKKRKVVFFDDDDDGAAGTAAGDTDGAPTVSGTDGVPAPGEGVAAAWAGSDRDYTHAELVARAFEFLYGKNPALATGSGRKRITLRPPQIAREGSKKTVFMNFGDICKSIHRQQDHLLAYMNAELGTTGNLQDGGRLVIKGRFTSDGIENVLRRYMREYVMCSSCRSPDTVLMRDANTRLYFLQCESCGATRSVAPIRQGFMAQIDRRKRK